MMPDKSDKIYVDRVRDANEISTEMDVEFFACW